MADYIASYPFNPGEDPAWANHINTIGDAINQLVSLPSGGGAAGDGSVAEDQDAETGRVTVDGTLIRYLYRYIHYRITSDAAGLNLVDVSTYAGSQVFIQVNNSSATMAVANAAYQSQAFAWASGHNIGYSVSGYGNISFFTQAADITGSFGTITNNQGTVDTQITTAAGSTGASAYEVAVTEGFSGSEAEWVASLMGSPAYDWNLTIHEIPADETTDPTTWPLHPDGDTFSNGMGTARALVITIQRGGLDGSFAEHSGFTYSWRRNGLAFTPSLGPTNQRYLKLQFTDLLDMTDQFNCVVDTGDY